MPSNKQPPNAATARAGAGMEFFNNPEPVWMACRATQGCKGKYAVLEMKQTVPFAGTILHYKCTTCMKKFTVAI